MPRWFLLPAFAAALLPALLFWWWQGRPAEVADAPSARVPCVSYAPYRAGQSPFDRTLVIPEAQIAEDLDRLAALTDCVRTYSVDQGLDAVPRLAAARGMSVLLGAWIGRERAKNERELASVITLAGRYRETVRAVVVGNEVLLRREQPPAELAAMIGRVRAAVPVPVTYADVWEFWEKNPEIAEAVDFVTIHILPYWEDDPLAVEDAVPHVVETWRRIQRLFPGRSVFIGEAGWPSAGRTREGARPGIVEQARFVRGLMDAAARDGIGINLIESFDQPWKRRLEGTVGGHWGLLDSERHAKFPLTGPVSAEPRWLARFTAAAAVGFVLLLSPVAGAAGAQPAGPGRWLAAALAAAAAGSVLTAGVADGMLGARTVWDWLVLAIRGSGAAAAAAFAVEAVLTGEPARPVAAQLLIAWLRGKGRPAAGWRATALGAVRAATVFGCAATTLCLVFDGRYRDFPVGLYALAAAALFLLAGISPTGRKRDRSAHLELGSGADFVSLAEERLLAVTAAAGAAVLVLIERLANGQAFGWLAAAAGLLVAVELDARGRACRYRRSSVSAPSNSPPAADSAA